MFISWKEVNWSQVVFLATQFQWNGLLRWFVTKVAPSVSCPEICFFFFHGLCHGLVFLFLVFEYYELLIFSFGLCLPFLFLIPLIALLCPDVFKPLLLCHIVFPAPLVYLSLYLPLYRFFLSYPPHCLFCSPVCGAVSPAILSVFCVLLCQLPKSSKRILHSVWLNTFYFILDSICFCFGVQPKTKRHSFKSI